MTGLAWLGYCLFFSMLLSHSNATVWQECECVSVVCTLNIFSIWKMDENELCIQFSWLYCQIYCEFIAFISSYCAQRHQKKKKVKTFKVTKNDGSKIALPFQCLNNVCVCETLVCIKSRICDMKYKTLSNESVGEGGTNVKRKGKLKYTWQNEWQERISRIQHNYN